jgi:hypothetical protein
MVLKQKTLRTLGAYCSDLPMASSGHGAISVTSGWKDDTSIHSPTRHSWNVCGLEFARQERWNVFQAWRRARTTSRRDNRWGAQSLCVCRVRWNECQRECLWRLIPVTDKALHRDADDYLNENPGVIINTISVNEFWQQVPFEIQQRLLKQKCISTLLKCCGCAHCVLLVCGVATTNPEPTHNQALN